MQRYSLSHFHSVCEWAAHSNLIPLFLYQRKGEREKKPSSLILHEYICSVYMCERMRVFVCQPICRWYWVLKIFLCLLSTRFSNVDVYHLSSPAIYHPLLLVDNPKGREFAKTWIFLFHLASLPFPFRNSYLAVCPVAAAGERQQRCMCRLKGVMWSLAGGFKEFGTSASYGWYSLNRPKSPLSFHAALVTGCSNHRSGTHDSWRWW